MEVTDLKYAIIGGDRRTVLLAEALARDGKTVHCYAAEKAEIDGCVQCACLLSCLYGAECVLLPIPAEKGGAINAPLSDKRLSTAEIAASLNAGQLLVGGGLSRELVFAAEASGVRTLDLMRDEEFAAYNAELTAEAAIGVLICESDGALMGGRALVSGYGRIGRALAERLRAMGAETTVSARSVKALSEAERAGFHAVPIQELESAAGAFDYIVNTVPARVFSSAALCGVAEGALLLELASAPGGFDAELARNIGLKAVHAPGLPGRFSPRSCAEYIKRWLERHCPGERSGKE